MATQYVIMAALVCWIAALELSPLSDFAARKLCHARFWCQIFLRRVCFSEISCLNYTDSNWTRVRCLGHVGELGPFLFGCKTPSSMPCRRNWKRASLSKSPQTWRADARVRDRTAVTSMHMQAGCGLGILFLRSEVLAERLFVCSRVFEASDLFDRGDTHRYLNANIQLNRCGPWPPEREH